MLTCAAGRMHNCTCMCCPPTCSHVLPTYSQCPLPVYAATFCPVPTFAATSCPVPTFAATSCPVPTYAVSCCPHMPLHANLMKLWWQGTNLTTQDDATCLLICYIQVIYGITHKSLMARNGQGGGILSHSKNEQGRYSQSQHELGVYTVLCVATYYYYKPSF